MDPNFLGDIPVRDAKEDLWHREQARRSQDTIRVYNPTARDFSVNWHPNLKFRIPASSTADVPRYIAEKYCRDMVVNIINEMGNKKAMELIEARKNEGKPEFLDKWEENVAVWNKVPKTNDEVELKKLYPQLWVGLVTEYGRDQYSNEPQGQELDIRTTEEKILGDLENKRVTDIPEAKPVIQEKPAIVAPAPMIACPICNKEFTTPIALSGHKRSHKAELEKEVLNDA